MRETESEMYEFFTTGKWKKYLEMEKLFVIKNNFHTNASSSAVSKAIENGDENTLNEMLNPNVKKYILENNLFKKLKIKI